MKSLDSDSGLTKKIFCRKIEMNDIVGYNLELRKRGGNDTKKLVHEIVVIFDLQLEDICFTETQHKNNLFNFKIKTI